MADFEQTKESLEMTRVALEAETQEVVEAARNLNDNLMEAVKRIWRQLLLIWAVVIVLAISYLAILSYGPPATRLTKAPGATPETAASAQTQGSDTVPSLSEREDLLGLLQQIRQAQYEKNIELFLGAYSPTFPGLEQKKEQTLRIWRRYDYLDMQLRLGDMQQRDASTIWAEVFWDIKARNRATNKIKLLSKTYRVSFTKEGGKWLIQSLE